MPWPKQEIPLAHYALSRTWFRWVTTLFLEIVLEFSALSTPLRLTKSDIEYVILTRSSYSNHCWSWIRILPAASSPRRAQGAILQDFGFSAPETSNVGSHAGACTRCGVAGGHVAVWHVGRGACFSCSDLSALLYFPGNFQNGGIADTTLFPKEFPEFII